VPVKDDQEKKLLELFDATFARRQSLYDEKSRYASCNAIEKSVFNVLTDNQGFGWTTGGHSGNPVPVYAIGNGMQIFGRWLDNTDIAPMLLDITGRQ
ncbi:MAG: hypothetical protein K2I52_02655, partial [Muribaculaceae bacterium]|nr:hypothetical protein [Muribaculaceae bacterium]